MNTLTSNILLMLFAFIAATNPGYAGPPAGMNERQAVLTGEQAAGRILGEVHLGKLTRATRSSELLEESASMVK